MVEVAATRASLLMRIRDCSDQASWTTFVDIYGPLVFHFGKRCGLQESDAADLVQEVMREVAKSIQKFDYDPELGKFRNWLYKISKRIIARLRKKSRGVVRGNGGTDALLKLENQPAAHDEFAKLWDREYGQSLIHWAAEQIRHQFQEQTWQAFWKTAVEEQKPVNVAKALGTSIQAVYIAKSRVLKRLTEKVREIDDR